MKKIVLGFLGLMCFMLPFGVSALEFKDSELLYKYEEVKPTCDAFDGSEWLSGVYNDKLVYEVSGDYYWITGNTCKLMTQTEADAYNEYMSSLYDPPLNAIIFNTDADDLLGLEANTVYDTTLYTYDIAGAYVLTRDTVVDTTGATTYYYKDGDAFKAINDPTELQKYTTANLYDRVIMTTTSDEKAVDGTTYYTYAEVGTDTGVYELTAATVTTGDDITGADYVVIGEVDKLFKVEKIKTLDTTKFADIHLDSIEVEYNEAKDMIYIAGSNKTTGLMDVYTLDGTKVKELSGSEYMTIIDNLIYVTIDGTLKIYNSELELLHEEKDIASVYTVEGDLSKGVYLVFDGNSAITLYYATTSKLPASPDTFDGVSMYIAMFLISLVGVVSATVCFKKKRHN